MRSLIIFALGYSAVLAILAIYYFQRSVRGVDDRPLEPEVIFGAVSAFGLIFGGLLWKLEHRLSELENGREDQK